MGESDSNKSIVKLRTGSLARYSSSLVRRGVEEISLRFPETLCPLSKRKSILVIGAEIGEILVMTLPTVGYHAKFVPSEGYESVWLDADLILPTIMLFSELSIGKYDMVIVAYWKSFEALLEIRRQHPYMKTIFLNSYKHEWDETAKQEGVNAVFRPDFEYDQLVDTINDLLLH